MCVCWPWRRSFSVGRQQDDHVAACTDPSAVGAARRGYGHGLEMDVARSGWDYWPNPCINRLHGRNHFLSGRPGLGHVDASCRADLAQNATGRGRIDPLRRDPVGSGRSARGRPHGRGNWFRTVPLCRAAQYCLFANRGHCHLDDLDYSRIRSALDHDGRRSGQLQPDHGDLHLSAEL